MDRLQHEIKDFHEKIKPTLKKVLEQYDKNSAQKVYNTIIKPCKRLIQKCSFKSVFDIDRLCSLAYWLYIYGHKELALEICEHTHGIDFEFEYGTADILNIYGLEIRIARELLGEDRRDIILSNLLGYYFSKRVKKELRYPQILREEEMAAYGYKFLTEHALYNMIGKGETGLYTELNKNWKKIEETIIKYIDYLKKE